MVDAYTTRPHNVKYINESEEIAMSKRKTATTGGMEPKAAPKKTVAELEAELSAMSKDLEAARSKATTLDARAKALEGEKKTLADANAKLTADLEAAKKAALKPSDLEARAKKAEAEVEALTKKLATAESERDDFKGRLKAKSEELLSTLDELKAAKIEADAAKKAATAAPEKPKAAPAPAKSVDTEYLTAEERTAFGAVLEELNVGADKMLSLRQTVEETADKADKRRALISKLFS